MPFPNYTRLPAYRSGADTDNQPTVFCCSVSCMPPCPPPKPQSAPCPARRNLVSKGETGRRALCGRIALSTDQAKGADEADTCRPRYRSTSRHGIKAKISAMLLRPDGQISVYVRRRSADAACPRMSTPVAPMMPAARRLRRASASARVIIPRAREESTA